MLFFVLILGFNCGEAVNFAIGDWFPLGAAASRRYANLRMLPLIPYEELLCKEAMFVYKSSRVGSSKNKPQDTAFYQAVMLSFLHLMQFYRTSLLRLNSSRKLSSSSNTSGSQLCRLCHRDCYVAYFLCKYCYSHPVCLFHGKTSLLYSFWELLFQLLQLLIGELAFSYHADVNFMTWTWDLLISLYFHQQYDFVPSEICFMALLIMPCRHRPTYLFMWGRLYYFQKEWHLLTGRSCQKFSSEKRMRWNILSIKYILLQQKRIHQRSRCKWKFKHEIGTCILTVCHWHFKIWTILFFVSPEIYYITLLYLRVFI